jgi:uncharacterized membrane protein YcjF (UPF0283 family)
MNNIMVYLFILMAVLAVSSFAVSYQHDKMKQKIYQRAERLGCDTAEVGAVLDKLLGRELRDLCALDDQAFIRILQALSEK